MPVLLRDSLHALAGQAASFEALLLMAAALHKGVKWRHLRGVVREFAGVHDSLAPLALGGVAVLEATAGYWLWLPGLRAIGALLAAALWTTYSLLMVRAIVKGRRDADCGCSFGAAHRPLGAYQLTRNAVLTAVAIGVAADARYTGGVPLPAGEQAAQLLAAFALLALYGAFDQVMGLLPLRRGAVL